MPHQALGSYARLAYKALLNKPPNALYTCLQIFKAQSIWGRNAEQFMRDAQAISNAPQFMYISEESFSAFPSPQCARLHFKQGGKLLLGKFVDASIILEFMSQGRTPLVLSSSHSVLFLLLLPGK